MESSVRFFDESALDPMSLTTSKFAIYAAFICNLLIAVTKLTAAAMTDSSAMLSEATHSLVDSGNQLLLLYGLKRAARPPSATHPFGYGLQLYFWTFLVAVMMFGFGAVLSFLQGFHRIIAPHATHHNGVNYLVLALSLIFESCAWWIAFRALRKTKGEMSWVQTIKSCKDSSLVTVLIEDTAAWAGLIVALLGIYASEALNMPIFDGLASIAIGGILALTSAFLAYELQSLLTGESASPEIRRSIQAIANQEPGVGESIDVLTMHFGPHDILVALCLHFEGALPSSQFQLALVNIERRIKSAHPEVTRVLVKATGAD